MLRRYLRVLGRTRQRAGDALPCLHLGMPKTATTCMQAYLFDLHSQVEYLGKYPELGCPDRSLDPAVQAMNDHLVGFARQQLSYGCRRKITNRVARALAEGRIAVWSREGHTSGSYKKKEMQAQFFRNVFGPCKVIIFVRRPDKFVESLYLQALQGFHKPSDKPPAWASHLGPPPRFISIETWLEANWSLRSKGMVGHMLCADTADAYANQFGRDNVRLFLFEQFVENPHAVIRDMCRFMGIDGEEGVRLMEGKRANDRWTVEQIERLKALENSPEDARAFREGGKRIRQRLLGLDELNRSLGGGPKARIAVPPDWLSRISEHVRDDHRRLVDRWELPLEQYGYSLDSLTRAA